MEPLSSLSGVGHLEAFLRRLHREREKQRKVQTRKMGELQNHIVMLQMGVREGQRERERSSCSDDMLELPIDGMPSMGNSSPLEIERMTVTSGVPPAARSPTARLPPTPRSPTRRLW